MASVREIKGRFYGRWRDEYGHRVEKLMPGFKTKREALREASKLEERAERVRRGFEDAHVPMTLDELWKLYVKAKARKASLQSDKSRWKTHVEKTLGSRPLHTIRPSDIEELLEECQTKGGVSGSSAEKIRMLIAALYTYAIRKKKCFKGENPARAADKPVIVEKPKFELEPRFVQPILDSVRERWRNLFAASVYTGARAGELKSIRLEDVNIVNPPCGVIIWRSNERDVTKGGKNRWLPIPPAASTYFKEAMRHARGIYDGLPQNQRPAPEDELLFPSDHGERLRVDVRLADFMREACVKVGLVKHFELACGTCGIGPFIRRDGSVELCEHCNAPMAVTPKAVDLVFHSLRATAASAVQALTGDMRQAQRLLGHKDLRTTEIYLAKNHAAFAAGSAAIDFSSHNFPTLKPIRANPDQSTPSETNRLSREMH